MSFANHFYIYTYEDNVESYNMYLKVIRAKGASKFIRTEIITQAHKLMRLELVACTCTYTYDRCTFYQISKFVEDSGSFVL